MWKKRRKVIPIENEIIPFIAQCFCAFVWNVKNVVIFFTARAVNFVFPYNFKSSVILFVCLTNKPNCQLRCLFETITNYMIKYFKCNCHLKTYLTKCCYINVWISAFNKSFESLKFISIRNISFCLKFRHKFFNNIYVRKLIFTFKIKSLAAKKMFVIIEKIFAEFAARNWK